MYACRPAELGGYRSREGSQLLKETCGLAVVVDSEPIRLHYIPELRGFQVRIDRLKLQNYKGFTSLEVDLDPRFNLFVGDNASGKTSILDAIKIGLDSWFIGMKGVAEIGSIDPDEVHVIAYSRGDSVYFEKQSPAKVEFIGIAMDRDVCWERELARDRGRTTTVGSRQLSLIASDAEEQVRNGKDVTLPLICAYGTERLWYESPQRKKSNKKETGRKWPSRFDGYQKCTYFEIQETDLLEWIREQVSAGQQRGTETVAFQVMREAIVGCVEGAKDIYYDERYRDLIVVIEGRDHQMFRNLSDGQRIMVSMIGDLAKRAVTLNPHLGTDALRSTPGVVTIDELDLHLHPKWQRRIIHDLKRSFTSLQFVVTSHSPQLVGEAQPNEIRLLQDGRAFKVPRSFGMDSNRALEEVMDASSRNAIVKDLLSKMSSLIEVENLNEARNVLEEVKGQLGDGDPEVTGANTLITLLESTHEEHRKEQ